MLPIVGFIFANCLSREVAVTAAGGVYYLNGESVQGQTYNLGKGVYKFTGIDDLHPVGFLKGSVELGDFFSVASDQDAYGTETPVGYSDSVAHYASDVRLSIYDTFTSLSMHCYNHGFMNGEDIFAYDEACDKEDDPVSTISIVAIAIASILVLLLLVTLCSACPEAMCGGFYGIIAK